MNRMNYVSLLWSLLRIKLGICGFLVLLLPMTNGTAYALDNHLLSENSDVRKAFRSFVRVLNPETQHAGSGVVLIDQADNGWIAVLTVEHVTRGSSHVYVEFPKWNNDRQLIRDRSQYSWNDALEGRVITEAFNSDLAVIVVGMDDEERKKRRIRDISVSRRDQCSKKDPIYILGDSDKADANNAFHVVRGKIMSWDDCSGNRIAVRTGETYNDVRIVRAHVFPGFSGGPVLNKRGRLIGIAFANGDLADESARSISVSYDRMEEILSEIWVNFQVPFVNRTMEAVRFGVQFGREKLDDVRMRWIWLESDNCYVSQRKFSIWDLATKNVTPRAFDKVKPRGDSNRRLKAIPWKVAGGDHDLQMQVSFLGTTLREKCEDFVSVYKIIWNSIDDVYELEWGLH